MFKKLKTGKIITLDELRYFLNNECFDLPKETPIILNNTEQPFESSNCYEVLADEDSIEFFDL